MKQEHVDQLLQWVKTVDIILKSSKTAQDTLHAIFTLHSKECEHQTTEEGPSDTKDCGHSFYVTNGWCTDCSSDTCPLINDAEDLY